MNKILLVLFLFTLSCANYNYNSQRYPSSTSHSCLDVLDDFQTQLSIHRFTYGIEFEGAFDTSVISRAELITNLQRIIIQSYPENSLRNLKQTHSGSTINFSYNFMNKNYSWKFSRDVNTVPKGYDSLEISSPILYTKADYEGFKKFLLSLKNVGIEEVIETSGTHFHIGHDIINKELAEEVMEHFSKFENEVRKLFFVMPTRGHIPTIQASNAHRRSLRFHPDFETLEVRFLNGVIEPEQIDIARDFMVKFVMEIRNKNPELMNYLSSENIKVENISKIIGSNLHEKLDVIKQINGRTISKIGRVSKVLNWENLGSNSNYDIKIFEDYLRVYKSINSSNHTKDLLRTILNGYKRNYLSKSEAKAYLRGLDYIKFITPSNIFNYHILELYNAGLITLSDLDKAIVKSWRDSQNDISKFSGSKKMSAYIKRLLEILDEDELTNAVKSIYVNYPENADVLKKMEELELDVGQVLFQ